MTNNYKKELIKLTEIVAKTLTAIDAEMKNPSTVERGKRIAKICNQLEMTNDSVMRFGLGYGWKKISSLKPGVENRESPPWF